MAKSLVEVLTEQGIESTESSNDRRVARCPFHEGDRDPSFVIYPNETYYCFGCHVWGNPVKFLVDYKGMSVEEAIKNTGFDYRLPKSDKKVIKVKNISSTSKFLYEVAQIYHEYLLETPGPLNYLKQRGLSDKTIQEYMIGYTDGAVLQLNSPQEYETANELGLLNKNGYEALSHRIIIPNIIDDQYSDFMIGRTVINDKIKYLGLRMPKPIMGFYSVRHSPIVFLVEGQFDWLILRQWGYPAIVMSGSHLPKTSLGLIATKQVVYIPDNDAMGQKAAQEIKNSIPSAVILDTSNLGTKDISEAVELGGAKEKFDVLVREQVWPTLLSTKTYQKWLPNSTNMVLSLSI